jgi:uncharacterized membrane protein YbhN (UPF0104 family)
MREPSLLFWRPNAERSSVGTLGQWLFGRGGVALILTLASIAVLIFNARLPSLGALVGSTDPRLVGLALAASTFILVAKAARWRVLFPPHQRPRLGLATAGIAVGQVVNWAFPTRLGEVVRVGLVNPHGRLTGAPKLSQGIGVGVGVLIVEKAVDAGMLFLSVALLIAVAGMPEWFRPYGLWLTAGIGVLAIGACLAVRWRGQPVAPAWARRVGWRLLPGRLRQLKDPIAAMALGLSAWWSIATAVQVLAWSAIVWGVGGLVNLLVLRGFDLQLSQPAMLGATLSILVALYGGAVIPALPGRLGIFQSLCVLALLPFGLSFDQALAVSVVMYAVIYVPPLVLGLLALLLVHPSNVRSG